MSVPSNDNMLGFPAGAAKIKTKKLFQERGKVSIVDKLTRIFGLVLFLSLSVGIACAGAEGPQGAPGLAGPQGEPGPAAAPAGVPALVAGGAVVDARAHPLSAAAGERLTGKAIPASGADEIIACLDEANVEKAMLASLGFHIKGAPDDAASTAENDFTAEEVAKAPDRLIGFCGINPLYPGALEEIDRCLALDGMVGIKLQMPFSGMDLANADHASALSAVFDKAVEHDAPVQMHTLGPDDPPMTPPPPSI